MHRSWRYVLPFHRYPLWCPFPPDLHCHPPGVPHRTLQLVRPHGMSPRVASRCVRATMSPCVAGSALPLRRGLCACDFRMSIELRCHFVARCLTRNEPVAPQAVRAFAYGALTARSLLACSAAGSLAGRFRTLLLVGLAATAGRFRTLLLVAPATTASRFRTLQMVELATRTGTAGISRAGRFRTLQMVELAERLRHDECVVRGKG
jgi:hypothetical protein